MRSRYVSTPIANTPTSTPVSGESIKGRKASPTAAPPNVVNGSGRSLPPPFAFAMTEAPMLGSNPCPRGSANGFHVACRINFLPAVLALEDLRASNLTRHRLVADALGGHTMPQGTETEAVGLTVFQLAEN